MHAFSLASHNCVLIRFERYTIHEITERCEHSEIKLGNIAAEITPLQTRLLHELHLDWKTLRVGADHL